MVLATKVDISREYVFSKISATDVYAYELPEVQIGQAICSPLRNDHNPSMILKVGQSGQLRHIDWAYPDDERFSGGPVDFIMSRYSLSYDKALRKICQDFHLLDEENKYKEITDKFTKPIMDIKRTCLIQVEARKWESRDNEYWNAYGVTKQQLRDENVYPIKTCAINRRLVPLNRNEVAYGYRFNDGWKLYFPCREKSEKWKCNVSLKLVENLKSLQNSRTVIIHKSKKDRLLSENLLPMLAHINTQNESTSSFTQELISVLQGKQVYLSFDCDPPGKESSLKINREHPQFLHVNVPDKFWIENKLKDWSDVYKHYGPEVIVEHFKNKKIIQ